MLRTREFVPTGTGECRCRVWGGFELRQSKQDLFALKPRHRFFEKGERTRGVVACRIQILQNERTPLGCVLGRASYHPKTPFTILSTKSHLMTPQMPKSLQFLPSERDNFILILLYIPPFLNIPISHQSILYIQSIIVLYIIIYYKI